MDQDARKLQGLLYLYAEKSHPHIRKRFVLKRALYASFMVAFIAGTYGSTSRDAAIHYAGLVVLVATIVTAFILFIMTLIQKKKLSDLRQACIDAYTERFIVKNLEHYFDNVSYNYKKAFTKRAIKTTQIFSNAPPNITYKFSGLLNATYNGTPFSLSYIRIVQHCTNGEERIVFNGYWIILKTKKKINSEICVLRKNTGLVGSRKVFETESNEFNRYYDVFSTDEKDIYYILTPDLMEELINYRETYGTISLSFFLDHANLLVDSDYDLGLWLIERFLEHADGTITDEERQPVKIDAQKIDSLVMVDYTKIATSIKIALNKNH